MTANAWLFVLWIVVGALFLYTHAILLYRVIRSGRIPPRLRWVPVFVPPLAPIFALWDGSRGMPALWLGLTILYIVLRFFE